MCDRIRHTDPTLGAEALDLIHSQLGGLVSRLRHETLVPRVGRAKRRDANAACFYESELGDLCPQDRHPRDRAADELAAALRAMELLVAGRYGFCDACGQHIEVERLKSRPHLLCCADCEAALRFRFAHDAPRAAVMAGGAA